MRKRNGALELYRFLLSLCVVAFHLNLLPGGYESVTFFFYASGYFLMQWFDRHGREQGVGAYMLGRIRRLMPFQLLAWLCYFLWENRGVTPDIAVLNAAAGLPNLLMADVFLQDGLIVIDNSWYITGMMTASLLIMLFLCRTEGRVRRILAPVLTVLLLCVRGTFYNNVQFIGPLPYILWTSLKSMAVGCWLYRLCGLLRRKAPDPRLSLAAAPAEALLAACLFLLMKREGADIHLPVCLLSALLLVSVMTLGSPLTRFLSNPFCLWLGGLSLPVYLMHGLFNRIRLEVFTAWEGVPAFLGVAGAAVLFAVITLPLANRAARALKK